MVESHSLISQLPSENAMFFTPPDSDLLQVPVGLSQTTAFTPINEQPIAIKPQPILSSSAEGWQEANAFYETTFVSDLLSATSPEEKNTILSEHVYSSFARAG